MQASSQIKLLPVERGQTSTTSSHLCSKAYRRKTGLALPKLTEGMSNSVVWRQILITSHAGWKLKQNRYSSWKQRSQFWYFSSYLRVILLYNSDSSQLQRVKNKENQCQSSECSSTGQMQDPERDALQTNDPQSHRLTDAYNSWLYPLYQMNYINHCRWYAQPNLFLSTDFVCWAYDKLDPQSHGTG